MTLFDAAVAIYCRGPRAKSEEARTRAAEEAVRTANVMRAECLRLAAEEMGGEDITELDDRLDEDYDDSGDGFDEHGIPTEDR